MLWCWYWRLPLRLTFLVDPAIRIWYDLLTLMPRIPHNIFSFNGTEESGPNIWFSCLNWPESADAYAVAVYHVCTYTIHISGDPVNIATDYSLIGASYQIILTILSIYHSNLCYPLNNFNLHLLIFVYFYIFLSPPTSLLIIAKMLMRCFQYTSL
jgi:hypothetical protein